MPALLINGWAGTTTITGTGNYTGIADVTSPNTFKSFADLSDGITFVAIIRTADKFEIAELTKTGGATPVLTRANILDQINGTTDPVNWGSGEKLIISASHGPNLMTKNADNVMSAHILMRGRRIATNSDDSDYLYSPADGQIYVILDGAQALALLRGGSDETIQELVWDHGGGVAGPILSLFRDKSDPTANNLLGYIPFSSRNSAGSKIDYTHIYTRLLSPANGSELGEIGLKARSGASMVEALLINSALIRAYAGINSASVGILVGKSAGGIGLIGLELLSSGQIAATADNLDAINVNRKNGDGNIVAVYRDDSFVGALRVDSGVVSVAGGGFTHVTALQGRPADEEHPIGTVLCSVDELLDDGLGLHPLSYVSREASDPAAYGVWWGRDDRGYPLVAAGGTARIRVMGPVRHGDLLETSEIQGVARAQADRLLGAATVAKARGTVPANEERTIPCTLMAG